MSQDTQEVITKYVALRDKKAVLKKAYEAEVEKVDKAMETIETYLMALMHELKVEALRSDAGTAYRVERVKASISDRDVARKFVLDNQLLDLLEMRASGTAVKQYMQEHGGAVPAGFAVITENTVQIRRS